MTFVKGQVHGLPLHYGGPRGIRTLDLLNAIETRSQLRYGPIKNFRLLISDLRSSETPLVNLWT